MQQCIEVGQRESYEREAGPEPKLFQVCKEGFVEEQGRRLGLG